MTWLRLFAASCLWCGLGVIAGCQAKESPEATDPLPSKPSERVALATSAPRLLYLPDGGDLVQNQGRFEPQPALLPSPSGPGAHGCSSDMVSIGGRFCIDRYEASLVDARERPLSPYYPPSRAELLQALRTFGDIRSGGGSRLPALPSPPPFSVQEDFSAIARSVALVVPSGYLSGLSAKRVCEAAGKRLCRPAEWSAACRGEHATKFPYGDDYAEGGCNVFREAHPAVVLFGDASKNHRDPRLNLVEGPRGPLLRKTGTTPSCRSVWGQDAVYDMVGNLDEWVESETGAFMGGFFSRGTREGCDAAITVHPPPYSDYSLGVRCCR